MKLILGWLPYYPVEDLMCLPEEELEKINGVTVDGYTYRVSVGSPKRDLVQQIAFHQAYHKHQKGK